MCDALFGGGGNSDAAEAARRDEEARQARIRAGMGQIDQTFSQFNDDYFDTRSKAYLDYATPQLEDQFAKAKEQLIFALSRGGNLNSSVAGERLADLTKQYDRNRTALADRGLALANDARSKVESARSDLVAQLQGSADPTSAAAQAAERAKLLAAPDTFEPLGALFQNITAGLAAAGNNPQTGYQGLGARLFGNSGGGSSRVVN